MFLELFRYVPYLKDERIKVQSFISGLSLPFKDQIEYNEPWDLEEVIEKVKHCYE